MKTKLPEASGHGGGSAGTVRDISERKRRERNFMFLADMQKIIAPLATAADLLRMTCERIAEHLELAHCCAAEVRAEADESTVLHDHHAPGTPNLAGDYRLSDFHSAKERQALGAGDTMVVGDVRADERDAVKVAQFEALGIRAVVNVGVVTKGRWSFILHASRGVPTAWTPEDVELLTELAARIYERLERARAEEQVLLLNAELEQRVAERTTELSRTVDALQREATERRRSESQIADNNKALEDFKAALDEHAIVAITDARGKITYVNNKFCAISKYAREDLLGQDHRIINSGFHPKAFIRDLWETITSGRVWHGEIKNRAKDGTFYWVATTLVPFLDAEGKPLQFVAIRADITERKNGEMPLLAEIAERKQLTVQLQSHQRELQTTNEELGTKARLLVEQNAEMEQARLALEGKAVELTLISRYKSEFLANMSHELRSPLNSILIFSRLLADNAAGNLTEKQVEFSWLINSSGNDLLDLITDVLDHAKIASGTVSVEPEEIPFAKLRDYLDRTFRPLAETKQLRLNVVFADDLPRTLGSDPKRLEQILKNLVFNAIKFTERGHIELRVGLATSGWSTDHPALSNAGQVIAFAVEDSGIGIATNKQRLIFEAFHQADVGTSRKYGGTGLGLAISRELAVLLGGEITLASVHGQGSTFTLFLPLHYSDPDAVRKAALKLNGTPQPHAPDEALRGRKVLVVDDDARNIFALTSLLENEQMDVVSAVNGLSAIDIIQRTPDLSIVLMDIMMPDMDGYETIREIRKIPEYATLPILALTAKSMKGDREKCLNAGASDYIAKPVNTGQLLSLMRGWLFR